MSSCAAEDGFDPLPALRPWFELDEEYADSNGRGFAQLQEIEEPSTPQEKLEADEKRRLLRISLKNLLVNTANGLPHGKHLIRRLLIRHPELWQGQ